MKYHHNSTVYRYLLLSKLQLRLCSHLDSCEVLREESEEDGQVCLLGDQTPLQTGIHLLLCVVCVGKEGEEEARDKKFVERRSTCCV